MVSCVLDTQLGGGIIAWSDIRWSLLFWSQVSGQQRLKLDDTPGVASPVCKCGPNSCRMFYSVLFANALKVKMELGKSNRRGSLGREVSISCLKRA